MPNGTAKKKAARKIEKAVRKAAKKGLTPGAVEKAVSQGMANGAKKKPVGRVGRRWRSRTRKRLELLFIRDREGTKMPCNQELLP